MSQGMYMLTGGAVDRIRFNLVGAGSTDVAGSPDFRVPVIWFQCTEISGTPTLAIGIYNSLSATLTVIRKATALTAGQEVLKDHGLMLEKNEYLRITIGAGNVDVAGQTLLGGALDN